MKMFGISQSGAVVEIEIKNSKITAQESLKGIVPPDPMHIGRLADGVELFVTNHGSTTIAFNLNHIEILTRYMIEEDEDGTKFTTPGWSAGVKTKRLWYPPEGFQIMLLVVLKGGGAQHQLLLVKVRDLLCSSYQECRKVKSGIMCTGQTTFAEETGRFKNLNKMLLAPRYLASTVWNGDLGSLTPEMSKEVFRWDLDDNQVMMDPSKFKELLCKVEGSMMDVVVPHKILIDRMSKVGNYDY